MKEKEIILQLLRANDWDRLEAEVKANPRFIDALIWALYQNDEETAWKAVEGFGRAIAAYKEVNVELCRDRMRRLYWALNDESGTSGCFAAPAVGEAVTRSPEVFGENALIIMTALDEPFLQAGAAWAFGRMAVLKSDLVLEMIPELILLLRSPEPGVRGLAAWALGQMGAEEAVGGLQPLAADSGSLSIYIDGALKQTTVGELAKGAIGKIRK
ncbi:MAG: DVU0298 family protein [Bacillota bacterium]